MIVWYGNINYHFSIRDNYTCIQSVYLKVDVYLAWLFKVFHGQWSHNSFAFFYFCRNLLIFWFFFSFVIGTVKKAYFDYLTPTQIWKNWNVIIRGIYRQSSVKIPPTKNTSSNNTLHIFHPFFTLPIITLAIVKKEQKSVVHLKIN